LRCTKCEGFWGTEECSRCYWDQGNALTDPFYLTSVKPFSYICCIFLVTAYVIGLWYTLRTHAAQIWETPLHIPEYTPVSNWRDNIPDEPFLKRIGDRLSSRFISEGTTTTTERETIKNLNIPEDSLRTNLTAEDSAMFVRNVAEVAAAAATLAIQHSHEATPTETPRIPPLSPNLPKNVNLRRSVEWDHDHEDQPGGGHDAPNWGRTKSSIVLLGATILYAIIAGISF
jgi:Ca2+:H+ antiporter